MANRDSERRSAGGGRTKSLANMWRRVRERLRAELGEEVFQSWFASVEPEELNGGTLSLSVPTKFLKSWIQSHYQDRVLALWKNETDKVMKVDIRVRTPVTLAKANDDEPSTDRAIDAASNNLAGASGFMAGDIGAHSSSGDLASQIGRAHV